MQKTHTIQFQKRRCPGCGFTTKDMTINYCKCGKFLYPIGYMPQAKVTGGKENDKSRARNTF